MSDARRVERKKVKGQSAHAERRSYFHLSPFTFHPATAYCLPPTALRDLARSDDLGRVDGFAVCLHLGDLSFLVDEERCAPGREDLHSADLVLLVQSVRFDGSGVH